jgi:hypothetical protein
MNQILLVNGSYAPSNSTPDAALIVTGNMVAQRPRPTGRLCLDPALPRGSRGQADRLVVSLSALSLRSLHSLRRDDTRPTGR